MGGQRRSVNVPELGELFEVTLLFRAQPFLPNMEDVAPFLAFNDRHPLGDCREELSRRVRC
jgi:hypothetical protein